MVAGLPGWRAAGAGGRAAGAVALPGTSRLVAGTELDPPVEGAFGAAVASGDFDRDGHADMIVGAPRADADDAEGREGAVTIVPGSLGRARHRPGRHAAGPGRPRAVPAPRATAPRSPPATSIATASPTS